MIVYFWNGWKIKYFYYYYLLYFFLLGKVGSKIAEIRKIVI
jgi:hypothetical protein